MNTSEPPSSPGLPPAHSWRTARRILLGIAVITTLIAIFYTVENWRGKQAWEKSRRELEAKGEILDWGLSIPPPVPDDQNFFKAPQMHAWFVRNPSASQRAKPVKGPQPFSVYLEKDHTELVIAEVKVAITSPSVDSQTTNVALRLDDPAARQQVGKLLYDVVGRCVYGPQNNVIVGKPLEEIQPLQLVLQTDTVPTVKTLTAFFPHNPSTNLAFRRSADINDFRVDIAGSNVFRLVLKAPVYAAADYLAWTEPLTTNFNLVREALQRPYARIDGEYQQPFAIPIPDFVTIRTVSQILSQRAQSYLLLGKPEAAWKELELIHDLCQILGGKPPSKPITLVAAMINVAVAGLYTGVVEDGLRLHAWREPELLAIERKLNETHLLPAVVRALKDERAGVTRTFETTKPRQLAKLFSSAQSTDSLAGFMEVLSLRCMPRGWFYQNMALGAELGQEWLGCVDLTNGLVLPHRASVALDRVLSKFKQRSPYTFLVARSLPNYTKAVQNAARNQTLVNQASLACSLERFRLGRGQYPETLDALAPQFIKRAPADLIGGGPLKYRLTDGGGYLLYSVGWDERDSRGVLGKSAEEGDWIWEQPL